MRFPKIDPIMILAVAFVVAVYSACGCVIASIWHGIEVWVHGYAQDSVVDTIVCMQMAVHIGSRVIKALNKWIDKHL